MKGAVNLDEFHRALVAGEDRERGVSDVLSVHGKRVRRFGGNRRRAISSRVPEAFDDVFRFDARPHHGAEFGELRANVGELDRQRSLFLVDVAGALDQLELLLREGGALYGTVRQAAIALRPTSGFDHVRFSYAARCCGGGSAMW
jgi:hypothetical protein